MQLEHRGVELALVLARRGWPADRQVHTVFDARFGRTVCNQL